VNSRRIGTSSSNVCLSALGIILRQIHYSFSTYTIVCKDVSMSQRFFHWNTDRDPTASCREIF